MNNRNNASSSIPGIETAGGDDPGTHRMSPC